LWKNNGLDERMTDVKTNVFIAPGFPATFCSMATVRDARQILDASVYRKK